MGQREMNDKGCINVLLRAGGQMLSQWVDGELMGQREMKDKWCIYWPMRHKGQLVN